MEELQRLATSTRIHLAIMNEPFLTYVFEGKKTVESRFSLHKIAPYKKVLPGDMVFMKAGSIVGRFTVAWVKYFDLNEYPIEEIERQYGSEICGDAGFWKTKRTKRYVTLLGIKNVERLTPLHIEKRDRTPGLRRLPIEWSECTVNVWQMTTNSSNSIG